MFPLSVQNINKKYLLFPSVRSKLASIERDLISSHQTDKLYVESLAVAKLKFDPNYFFRYEKKCVC